MDKHGFEKVSSDQGKMFSDLVIGLSRTEEREREREKEGESSLRRIELSRSLKFDALVTITR